MADDIRQWLEELGLGKYGDVFVENGIDVDVVADLDKDDLQQLGVNLGDSKRLLRAIAPLDTKEATPARNEIAEDQDQRSIAAERRQLTVMFCDLVGSTALSRQLDPEDLRDVMQRYQDAVAGAVTRYGGYVAKYLGDGVLTYFGWPHAYEDQVERAVKAGMNAVAAVANLDTDDEIALSARVGVATGQVVVGDLVGEGGRDTEAVSGETPNLAARLQQLAAPGEVIIGAATRRLAGHLFSLKDLGMHDLKGFAESIPAWKVIGETKAESRFSALHGDAFSNLVGRESELNLILNRWRLAKTGEGQVILLSGEAGIGKSRITQAIRDEIKDDDYICIRYQCSPHHTNSPFYPAIQQMEFAAGFISEDGPEAKLNKLEGLLDLSSILDAIPLIAAMLSVPTGDRYPKLDLTPQEQKIKTLQALVAILKGLSLKRPVLFLFEDAHWIDPTTREQMSLAIDQIATQSILLLMTHRPEFETSWAAHSHCTSLALNRLGREACADVIYNLTEGLSLPAEVFEQIVTKTDGVPLFVEELTKTILESDLLTRRDDRYTLEGPLPPLAIPSTLQDSLMARLDRLEKIKEVAQFGASIGREVPYALLEAISPLSGPELEDALSLLIESEIMFRRGDGFEAVYVFKHALIQDAAYESLLRSRRQQIHASIAKVLQTRFAERLENEPEVLAHHYTQAGLLQQAAPVWLKSGQRAVSRSANLEAIAHLGYGLEVVAQLPAELGVRDLELDMQISLGSALIAALGYSSVDTENAWLRARQLLNGLGEDPRQFAVLHGLCMVYWNRAQLTLMQEVNEDMLARAGRQNDVLPRLVAHRVMSVGLNPMGEFESARENGELATKLYDPVRDQATAHQFGHDQGVGANWHLAIALLFLGFPDASADAGAKASALAEKLQNATTTGYNSLWAAFTNLVRRDWEGARRVADQMIEDASARSMALWVVFGRHLLGAALVNLGEPEAALQELRHGREEAEKLNNKIFKPMTLRFEAQALSALGQHSSAVACLDGALEIIEATEERWWESDIWRLRGEILQSVPGMANDSENNLRRAIMIAKDQKARLLELRSATALGHLWRKNGRDKEACELVTPIFDWFTEGFDAPDLKDAKALLEELA